MKALKPLTQKLIWLKDKKYDNTTKAHHNSWIKTINQRNVTRRRNRHSRTKNGDGSILGKWNNFSQRTLAPHLKCWEKYNWLRILYLRKVHIKNKIKYFLRHTTTTRLHHNQQTFYKRFQVRRNLKRSENLDLQVEWTVPKMINM